MSFSATESDDPARSEYASEWCFRLAEGCLSAKEQQRFDQWIDSDPLNLDAFERTVRVWHRIGEAATAPEFIDIRERALAMFRRRNRARWSKGLGRPKALVAVAAGLLFTFCGIVFWLQSRPDVYQTGVGERRVVMLADGSRISLDAETVVDVRLTKDRRDLVLIGGRAKFDVAKDPQRPFSVDVGNKIVVATGTSFSVELLRKQVNVVLYEGQVAVLQETPDVSRAVPLRLSMAKGPADLALKPGHELIAPLAQMTATVSATDIAPSLSWEVGQLIFIDEHLSVAVERVNRYSPRKVRLADRHTETLLVNGIFNAGDVESFIVGLRETLPVRIIYTGNDIVVAIKRA